MMQRINGDSDIHQIPVDWHVHTAPKGSALGVSLQLRLASSEWTTLHDTIVDLSRDDARTLGQQLCQMADKADIGTAAIRAEQEGSDQ